MNTATATATATPSHRAQSLARLRTIVTLLQAQPQTPLSLSRASALAACSPFHFQRQFSALAGMSAQRYGQLYRLQRAAAQLAFRPWQSITEIALDNGYGSPEAFARAFQRALGATPSAHRTAPDAQAMALARIQAQLEQAHAGLRMQDSQQDQDAVRILDVPATPVAQLTHRGPPGALGSTLQSFIAWRRARGLRPPRSATFNLLHDDPRVTPPEQFRLTFCAATEQKIEPNAQGVEAGVIPAGRCATLEHRGDEVALARALDWLYRVWLPESGEYPRDFPPYVQRHSFAPEVPAERAASTLYLPLR